MIKNISFSGISRIPSARLTDDGACAESLNVQVDNGEIAPAIHPKDITAEKGLPTNKKYEILMEHKGNGYDQFICMKDVKSDELAATPMMLAEEAATTYSLWLLAADTNKDASDHVSGIKTAWQDLMRFDYGQTGFDSDWPKDIYTMSYPFQFPGVFSSEEQANEALANFMKFKPWYIKEDYGIGGYSVWKIQPTDAEAPVLGYKLQLTDTDSYDYLSENVGQFCLAWLNYMRDYVGQNMDSATPGFYTMANSIHDKEFPVFFVGAFADPMQAKKVGSDFNNWYNDNYDTPIDLTWDYDKVRVTGIKRDTPSVSTLEKGQSLYAKVTVLPLNADDREVIWSADDPSMVEFIPGVDSSEVTIKTKKGGEVKIFATTHDGEYKVTFRLTIVTYVKAIGTWDDGVFVPFLGLEEDEEYRDITAVGNSLVVATNKRKHYVVRRDDKYIYLGDSIPMPQIELVAVDEGIEYTRVSELTPMVSSTYQPVAWQDIYVQRKLEWDWEMIDVMKVANKIWEDDFDIREAAASEGEKYIDTISQFQEKIMGRISAQDQYFNAKGIYAYPVFASMGVVMFDGTVNCNIPIILGAGFEDPYCVMFSTINTTDYGSFNARIYRQGLYKAAYRVLSLPENIELWSDFIAGVKFYTSTPIGQKLSSIKNYKFDEKYRTDVGQQKIMGELIYKPSDYSFDEELKSNAILYEIKDIPLNEFLANAGGELITINTKDQTIAEKIVTSPLLNVQRYNEVDYIFSSLSNINRRLLATIEKESYQIDKRQLSAKMGIKYSQNKRWAYLDWSEYETLQSLPYKSLLPKFSKQEWMSFRGKYTFVKNNKTFVLPDNTQYDGCYNKEEQNFECSNAYAFIISPFVNTKEVQVKAELEGDTYIKTLPMVSLPSLGVSYYYGGLDNLLEDVIWNSNEDEKEITGNTTAVNKLLLSNVDAPFSTPTGGIQTFTSRIIGTGAITKPLSEGQFGQFQLYVFTDGGIYAMNMNEEGTFSTQNMVSREIALPGTISSMEQGVIFASAKGVMMLTGSDIVNLSENMNGRHYILENSVASALVQTDWKKYVPVLRDNTPFMKVMANASGLYDYAGQRFIFATTDKDNDDSLFQYVLKLDTHSWHKLSQLFDENGNQLYIKRALNSYPDAYAQVDAVDGTTRLYNLSTILDVEQTEREKGVIITRAFDLEAPDIYKTITKLKIRGIFCNDEQGNPTHPVKYLLLGSNDGTNFTLLHSLRGKSWKFFRMIIFTDMQPADRFTGVQIEYETRFDSQIR